MDIDIDPGLEVLFDIGEPNLTLDVVTPAVELTLDINTVHISGGAGQTYNHTQLQAASVWTINHNLGRVPITQAFNSASQPIMGQIVNTSVNQCVIQFNLPVSGFAKMI